MYIACGIAMLVPGLFLFIMNYFNYKWLRLEEQKQKKEELQIGSAKELTAVAESFDNEEISD